MGKHGRAVEDPESLTKEKKKKKTHQNGSADAGGTRVDRNDQAAFSAPAALAVNKAIRNGKGKKKGMGGHRKDAVARQDEEQRNGKVVVGEDVTAGGEREGSKDGRGGGVGGRRKERRKRRKHDEEGYEGPVVEDDSDSPGGSSHGSDDSSDDSDDSDDDIKLGGAMSRRSDAEEDGEEEEEEHVARTKDAGDEEQTVVDVCLDFCDPHERFFHGIRALVAHSYLQDAAGAGLSQLVDLAVAQGAVGTVLSTDAEDDVVFGFVTALPLRFLAQENQCVQAVTKYLLDKASKAGRGSEMQEVLGEGAKGKAGLLVCERMINCPMQAVPKLHEALAEDIAWAIENEISEEHRDKFRFDKFIVVAPCDDASGGVSAVGAGPAMLSDFYFSRFDDEVFLQEADFFFPMGCASPTSGSSGGGGGGAASNGGGGPQLRYVVGVLPAKKLRECVQGIAQMVG